jgi:hypothetical protein
MAGLPLSKLVLNDGFPGPVNPNLGIPKNGWNRGGQGCVTSPEYPVGTKIMAYTDNTHCPGWYTMYYGTLASYCADADVSADFSDGKFWCSHTCLTADAADATYELATNDGSSQPAYVLASCYTTAGWDGTKGAPIAVPCASMDGYDYGWFWVGGVCPCADATIIDGTSGDGVGVDVTTDDVRAGAVFLEYTATTGLLTAIDITQISDATGAVGAVPVAIGYSMEAD